MVPKVDAWRKEEEVWYVCVIKDIQAVTVGQILMTVEEVYVKTGLLVEIK